MANPDDDSTTGSGDGGTLGTPTTDNTEDVPSNTSDTSVVSGGGVADTSQADRDDAARPGLRAGGDQVGGRTSRTPNVIVGLIVIAAFLLLLYLLA